MPDTSLSFGDSYMKWCAVQRTPVSSASRTIHMTQRPSMPPSSGSIKPNKRLSKNKPHLEFFNSFLNHDRLGSSSLWLLQKRNTGSQQSWSNMRGKWKKENLGCQEGRICKNRDKMIFVDFAKAEYCSTFTCPWVTGGTSHIPLIFIVICAMWIIRGPIKPFIFWK